MTANLDYEVSGIDRAHLAVMIATEGYGVLHKIMLGECEKFTVALLNTDPADKEAVLAAHVMAKAAAQYMAGVVQRVNNEIEYYRLSPKASDAPEDVMKDKLDFGEAAEADEPYQYIDFEGLL